MICEILSNRKKVVQPAIGWCLAFLILSVPYSAALANVFSIAVVVLWLGGGTVKEDFKSLVRQPFVRTLIFLMIIACLSLLWTRVDFGLAWEGLRKFRKFIFLFVCWVYLCREVVWRKRLLFLMLFSFGVMAILCVGVYVGIPGLPSPIPGQGAVLSRSHISQGYVMSILVVVCMGYLMSGDCSKKLKIISLCFLIVSIAVTFFMTNGRTGYICIFSALLFIVIGYGRSIWKKIVLMLSVVMILGVAGFNSPNVVSRIVEIKTDVTAFMEGNNNTSSGQRLSFWTSSISMLKNNPVFGVGVGSWSTEYCLSMLAPGDERREACYRQKGPGNPHSDILNFSAQFGVIGLLCWLCFLVICIKKCMSIIDAKERVVALGMLGAYLAGGMVNSFVWDVIEGILFCVTMAWVLSADVNSKSMRLDVRQVD